MKSIALKVAFIALAMSSFFVLVSADESVGSAEKVCGQKFEKWTASGDINVAKPASPSSPVKISGDTGSIVVTASFSTIPPPSTLALKVKGKGATSPNQDSVTRFKDVTAEQKISAKPDKYSKFEKWEVSGPVALADSSALETVATVSGPNATVTAVFSAGKGWLTTSVWGKGSIDSGYAKPVLLDVNVAQSIKATPAEGYKFSRWQTSGSAKVKDSQTEETEVSVASYGGHVTAVFTGELQSFSKPLEDTSTASAGVANLSISVSGKGSTEPVAGPYRGTPSKFTIKAIPGGDALFEHWESSGKIKLVAPESAETEVYVLGNASVKAVFLQEHSQLRVKANQGGTIAAPAKEVTKVKTNQAERIAAVASEGFKFLKWTVNGQATIANAEAAESAVTLKGNATVNAVFAKVQADPPQQQSSQQSNAPGGTLMTVATDGAIAAKPPTGFHFLAWRSTGIAKVSDELAQSSKVTFNGSGSSTLSASFMPDCALLKIVASGSGSVNPAAGQTLKLKLDESLALTATPDTNFKFTGWRTTEGVTVDKSSSPTIKATVTASSTLTAVFEPDIAKLTTVSSGGGYAEPSTASLQMGVPVSIEATPYDGFKFQEWKTEGLMQLNSAKSQKTYATLSGDATATAVFVPEWATLTLAVAGEGRTAPASCKTINVKPGSWTRITAFPAKGSTFNNWTTQGLAEVSAKDSQESMVKVEGGDALAIANMTKTDGSNASASSSDSTTAALAADAAATASSNQKTALDNSSSVSQFTNWVNASDGTYADRIKITWSYPAANFEVWRKEESAPDSSYAKIIDFWPGQSYEDFSATPDGVFTYKVVAKSKTGAILSSATDNGSKKR